MEYSTIVLGLSLYSTFIGEYFAETGGKWYVGCEMEVAGRTIGAGGDSWEQLAREAVGERWWEISGGRCGHTRWVDCSGR